MTCELSKERMIEVLYDEVESPRGTGEFFRHLDDCPACRRDFLDLIQARKWLGSWEVEEEPEAVLSRPPGASGFNWWSAVQKLAASVLIVVGALSVLRGSGLWGDRVSVSEKQLMELVTDIVVLRQAEHERVIGQALQSLAESASLEQAVYHQDLGTRLNELEQNIVAVSEERDRLFQMLAVQ